MLEGIDYVALLHTKRAEMRALAKLEKAPRDRMFPILVARPGDHHDMEKTWPAYASAVGPYRYGLDIDRTKFGRTNPQPARAQFDSLFDRAGGFATYFNRVRSMEGAIPVLRTEGGSFVELDQQFEHVDDIDRGLIVRIEKDFTKNLADILDHRSFNPNDTLIVVDCGWAMDVLALEAWASEIISQITAVFPDIEISSLSSCFPRSFSHIDDKGIFSIDDRELYNRLVRRHNAANLKFGDWGSTRSAKEQGGGVPWPRIDIASTGDWTCFRRTKDEVGYRPVAIRCVDDRLWNSTPACWGKNIVHSTALGLRERITGTELATSVRVNLHLTVQALGGASPPTEDVPYVDSF